MFLSGMMISAKSKPLLTLGRSKRTQIYFFITFNNHVTGSNSDTIEHAVVMLISAHGSHPFYRFTQVNCIIRMGECQI